MSQIYDIDYYRRGYRQHRGKLTDREFEDLMESARTTEGLIVACIGGAALWALLVVLTYMTFCL